MNLNTEKLNFAVLDKEPKINGSKVPVFEHEAFKDAEFLESNLLKNEVYQKKQELVNKCLINLSEKMEPPPVAMQIVSEGQPITLFTKGNFSIITGAAKSRKSFLISLLIAATIKGKVQELFICNGSGISIIFDTEQARYKVQQIARRICSLSETCNPSNLQVYSLRTLEPSQRLEFIDYVLATTPNINFVAIDGIIDLEIDPILQADQAQRIIMKLMQWSEMYNIHITCVLHYNKTVSTLLGHLGSFSHRKADAVIEVSKDKEDVNISIVRAIDCREKEFAPFAFSVDPHGMPYVLKDYTIEKKGKEKKVITPKVKAITANDLEDSIHEEILKKVFKVKKEHGYRSLWETIQNAFEAAMKNNFDLGDFKPLSDDRAKKFIPYYIQTEKIIHVEGKKPVYVLAGQKQIFE